MDERHFLNHQTSGKSDKLFFFNIYGCIFISIIGLLSLIETDIGHRQFIGSCVLDDEITPTSVAFDQEIINMNRNGNSVNFFSYVCNGKKLKSCLPLL